MLVLGSGPGGYSAAFRALVADFRLHLRSAATRLPVGALVATPAAAPPCALPVTRNSISPSRPPPEILASALRRPRAVGVARTWRRHQYEGFSGRFSQGLLTISKSAELGPVISTGLVAAIGTGEAFERGRDFGAWLGLVPRQYSTGGRSVLGRISKRGSKYLRTLLIQAAKVLLMRPHHWPRYSFGAWLKTASERLHRNKLAVALANKLARIAWSVLRNDKAFDTHLVTEAI